MTTDRRLSPFPLYTGPADVPSKALTPMEEMICTCVERGWDYPRIARECQISVWTAYTHVQNIADKLPSEEGVKAYHRVFLWLQHRRWVALRTDAA